MVRCVAATPAPTGPHRAKNRLCKSRQIISRKISKTLHARGHRYVGCDWRLPRAPPRLTLSRARSLSLAFSAALAACSQSWVYYL